jgi:Putative transposase, YhgA-like
MADSDSLYHRLFSHPRMVEELVRQFVPAALVTDLDFSGLRRVNPKFHIGRRSAARRESDVIWRLPTRKGVDVYLYLLIEFQSQSDWWMAVRAQVYQGLLWQQVIQEQKLKSGARLPPLLLLVLYNGEQRWSAPTDLSELIGLKPHAALWHWQPQLRYYLLDMGAFAENALRRRDSLVALLFRLERSRSPQQLQQLIVEVIGWFRRHEGLRELKGLFSELVRQAIRGTGTRARVPDDLLEMKSMLATLGKTWRAQWLAEGLAKGKAEALVCLLISRFGPLPPSFRKRIRGAKLASIERWFNRALDAHDLSSVFNSSR